MAARPGHLARTVATARRRRKEGKVPPPSLGTWLSDGVAATVGSWRFILIQSAALLTWIAVNAMIGTSAWDPYPFILLNLMLSFQAAYTAPIIMMSQNRQSEVDRHRALADYEVNLRAEADITLLHEKIDLLREQQMHELNTMLRDALKRIDQLEGRGAAPLP